MEKILAKLPGALLPWYNENKRDLPWRRDRQPYHVWLSEIMLQQTRVEAVRGYYARFLESLPTVEALASCPDDRLHKLWEGLGYYSRVRNLKKAAQQIVAQYNGVFPSDYQQIRALHGIGDYTAGAVCSICFDMPTPAVDGNVLRVVSRLLDDATPIDLPAQKKAINKALSAIYPAEAGEFTQALIELGATVCGPNRAPDCDRCPCRAFCLGHQRGTAPSIPVKSAKKERRQEDKTVFILRCDGYYAVTKRPEKGLLAGLWQLPDVAGKLDAADALANLADLGVAVKDILRQTDKTHIFTHVQWNMRGYYMDVKEAVGDYLWLTPEKIDSDAALPTAFRQFWLEHEFI